MATWPPLPRRLREICVISGFRREVDESHALLGYYSASSGNSVLTFRDNLTVPSSGVKNGRGNHLPWRQTYSSYHLWKRTFSTMLQLGEIIAVWAWRELKLMERRKMWVHTVIRDGRNIGLENMRRDKAKFLNYFRKSLGSWRTVGDNWVLSKEKQIWVLSKEKQIWILSKEKQIWGNQHRPETEVTIT